MPPKEEGEISVCSLDPASVFAAWKDEPGTVGLWNSNCREEPIELYRVPDPAALIRKFGSFFLMWKPHQGEWEALRVEEMKTGHKYVCSYVACIPRTNLDGRRIIFLLDDEKGLILEKTSLKFQQEFIPFVRAESTTAALG